MLEKVEKAVIQTDKAIIQTDKGLTTELKPKQLKFEPITSGKDEDEADEND